MALSLTYNCYASVDEATYYFADRMDVTAWDSASADVKAKALVSATRQIDKENFVGSATSSTQALSFPRKGSFMDDRTGFLIEMDYDYDFAASQPASAAAFPQWFHELPREVRYLKSAVYEQALWLVSNSGVINSYSETSSSSGSNETIRVGQIEISGSAASSASSITRRTNPMYFKLLQPIMAQGGSGTKGWWRAN